MPGFINAGEYARCFDEGRSVFCSFRKVPSQASTAGWWVDLSMAAGNPPANFYAAEPLVADVLDPLKGIYHGGPVSPEKKYLASWGLSTPTAALLGEYKLLDYVAYYPFIDMDSTDEQVLDNTTLSGSIIPRYQTTGCQVMVVTSAPTIGAGQFTFTYLNQAGVLKTSPNQFCGTAVSNISNLHSQQATVGGLGPFLRLDAGDTGVTAIQSVTFTVPNGGLAAFVLVRPIAHTKITEITSTTEVQYLREAVNHPEVPDDAYLGLITNCAATVAAGQLMGYATFIWK